MMISIVIAAHNEAGVIGRSLDLLLAGAEPDEFEVVVVANGCTDATAAIASARPGVRVLDRPEPGKPAALDAGDAVASGFPRLYLDADIGLGACDVRELARAVRPSGTALAAAPARRLIVTGRPVLVRGYAAVHSRLPAMRGALYGRGAVVLSREGRARFDGFPPVIADDLFLDSLFDPAEKAEVSGVVSRVEMPRTTRDLLRRLERVRRGNSSLRAAAPAARRSRPWSWLVDVVLPRPWLLPAGVCYAAITLLAARRGRRAASTAWGRDESTRQPAGSPS